MFTSGYMNQNNYMKLVLVSMFLLLNISNFKTEEDIKKLDFSIKNLSEVMDYYGIQHKDIVIRQFILETGRGTSYSFRKRNNLFGLYNSKTHDYFVFDHWSESVRGYRDAVQYKYLGGNDAKDYYKFLKDLPYAMDSNYINKLKNITYDIQ